MFFWDGCWNNHFLSKIYVNNPIETTIKKWFFGVPGAKTYPWEFSVKRWHFWDGEELPDLYKRSVISIYSQHKSPSFSWFRNTPPKTNECLEYIWNNHWFSGDIFPFCKGVINSTRGFFRGSVAFMICLEPRQIALGCCDGFPLTQLVETWVRKTWNPKAKQMFIVNWWMEMVKQPF